MALTATRRRRLAGLVFLGIALVLLITGQTLLRSHLTGVTFLVYWFACLGALALAVMTALLDLLIIRQSARQQQRELLRQTFHDSRSAPPTPDAHTKGKN